MDRLNQKIVKELQIDASQSNSELAARVGSTGPSCWRRIKQLEEDGVLGATVRLADRKALNLNVNVICQVRLSSHSTESVEGFEEFVANEKRIMECYSMSGDWDYLLQVVAEDVESYEAFLMRRLLKHPSVGGASSHFALRIVKYQTALPIAG